MKVCILGDGGHARDLQSCFEDSPDMLGPDVMTVPKDAFLVTGIADCKIRKNLVKIYGRERFISVQHPSAVVDKRAEIGHAVQIMAGCVVQSYVTIGDFVMLGTGAQVSHDSSVGHWSFLAPGSVVVGGVKIGENVFVGANATILPNVTLGDNSIIGAGAVVVHNVAPNTIVVGNPARVLRNRRDEE